MDTTTPTVQIVTVPSVAVALEAACAEAGVTAWQWFPVAEQTTHVLTDTEIEWLEARCAETERGDDYDSASECAWM